MTADNSSANNSSSADQNNEQLMSSPEQPSRPTAGPGHLLKQAREAKSMTAREAADRLRLRLQVIELIEADDYATFSTTTFVKGYLRAYAKLLGVDQNQIDEAYKSLNIKEPESTPMQSFSRRVKHQESDNRLMMITWLVVVVVIALVIWWWQDSDLSFSKLSNDVEQAVTEQSDVNPEQTEADPPTLRQSENQRSSVAEEQPVLESEVSAADASTSLSVNDPAQQDEVAEETIEQPVSEIPESVSNDDAATQSEPDTPSEPTNAPADEEAGETPVVEAPPEDDTEDAVNVEPETALVIEFSEECWVKIEDADGEVQAIGTKAQGYRMPVPGSAPFSATICKPAAVTITYAGNTLDLSQYRQDRVARLTIPSSN
mgnify:CR=1 FL=1